MGKAVLILILGSIGIFGIVNLTTNARLGRDRDNAVDHYSSVQLRYICNSAAEVLLGRLGDNYYYRAASPVAVNLNAMVPGASVVYKVVDEFVNGDSLVKISITAKYGNKFRLSGNDDQYLQKSVELYAQRKLSSPFPPGIKGAITARTNMTANGNLTIDGRDHTLSNFIVPKSGIWGIWTTAQFQQLGALRVGGTDNSIDYMPSNPADPAVVKEYQVYTGDYLDSPDKVLGMPNGTAKSTAQSGVNGSQYTTNPNALTYPLKGITYVELPINGSLVGPSSGEGILIVHNSNKSACLRNMSGGSFKGIIITDDINLYKGDVLGAIVSLTTNPSGGSIMGNGSGTIKFSREAILKATGAIKDAVKDFGHAKHRMVITGWYE
jgi:hypothetical protein